MRYVRNLVICFLLIVTIIGCDSSNPISTKPDTTTIDIDTSTEWVQTSKLTNSLQVMCLESQNGFLSVGTYGGGYFVTSDNGKNWISSNFNDNTHYRALGSFINKNGNTTLLAGATSLLSSSNNGLNWKELKRIDYGTGIQSINVIPSKTYGFIIFIGIINSLDQDGGEYRSTDEGNSWVKVNSGLPSDFFHWDVTSNYDGSYIYGYNYTGLYYSTDEGLSWLLVNKAPENDDITSIIYVQNEIESSRLFIGTYYNGVYYSTDNGVTWIELNDGLTEKTVRSFAVYKDLLFVATYGGVFLFEKETKSWKSVNQGLKNLNIRRLIVHEGYLISGTEDGEVWRCLLSNF